MGGAGWGRPEGQNDLRGEQSGHQGEEYSKQEGQQV